MGKTLFEDVNAWVTLSDIFTNVLQDPYLKSTYLIIDALDECTVGLPKLLDFIAQKSSLSPHVKWLVSSRNWPPIEERLEKARHEMALCLELNAESVSAAVSIYIRYKLHRLAQKKKYDEKTRDAVLDYLLSNADDTFLWVALVCQNPENIPRARIRARLKSFPPGFDSLYERMMKQICDSEDSEFCNRILASIATVYEPVTLKELAALVETHEDMSNDLDSLREISAKDYLLRDEKAFKKIFPTGRGDCHYELFSTSIQILSRTLRRDIYNLHAPGFPIESIKSPLSDLSVAARYFCFYWIDHLCDWNPNFSANHRIHLQAGVVVDLFIRKNFLYWLEALSLCKGVSKGVLSIAKLGAPIQGTAGASGLIELVRDEYRFIMYHKWAIENSPLQTYASALVFSPTRSLIRGIFKKEEPKWVTIKSSLRDDWSACLQTLEGHIGEVTSFVFSHDSTQLASGSDDYTIKIWDVSSAACLQPLEGHSDNVRSVIFSHNSTQLASASDDYTVKIWDISSGACLQTLIGHSYFVYLISFSQDSTPLASASEDYNIKIWDISSGICQQTLHGHDWVESTAFTHNSTQLASATDDCIVRIWDVRSGVCLQALDGHGDLVHLVAFSHNSTRLISSSYDKTMKIWDVGSGACLQTLGGHSGHIRSIAFSHDSIQVASASYDRTIKIWDAGSGECLRTISVGKAFSTLSFDNTGSYLRTEIGDFAIDASSAPSMREGITTDPQIPRPEGLNISLDEAWIMYNSENLLRLPPEYRPSCFAVSGKTIGMGGGTGKVWIYCLGPR